jgi:hypothetical protein
MRAAAAGAGELACRWEHRRQMIDAAVSRWRRGWEAEADAAVSGLWDHYHQVASADFPDVRMRYRGDAPPDSYTVSFDCLPRVDSLPKCRIDHVMERGTVDIFGLWLRRPN